jgi:hypothetical protein
VILFAYCLIIILQYSATVRQSWKLHIFSMPPCPPGFHPLTPALKWRCIKAVRKNNFSNGAGAITDRTLEKQAFLIILEGVAEVIFAHRLRGLCNAVTSLVTLLLLHRDPIFNDLPHKMQVLILGKNI